MSVKLPFQKPAQKPSSLRSSLGLWLSCTMRWSPLSKGVILRETNSEFTLPRNFIFQPLSFTGKLAVSFRTDIFDFRSMIQSLFPKNPQAKKVIGDLSASGRFIHIKKTRSTIRYGHKNIGQQSVFWISFHFPISKLVWRKMERYPKLLMGKTVAGQKLYTAPPASGPWRQSDFSWSTKKCFRSKKEPTNWKSWSLSFRY